VIKKSLCTWWLQYRKLKVCSKFPPPVSRCLLTRRTVLEDGVQYSTVHIPNAFCDGHLQIINCVGTVQIHWDFSWFLYYNHQVHRDFFITVYLWVPNVEIVSCHPFGGWNFEVGPRVLENMCPLLYIVYYYTVKNHAFFQKHHPTKTDLSSQLSVYLQQ
jgi:hypothetical protein